MTGDLSCVEDALVEVDADSYDISHNDYTDI